MNKIVVTAAILTLTITFVFIGYASYVDSIAADYTFKCIEICESNGYQLQGLEPPPNVKCVCRVSIASVKIYEVRLP